MTNKLSKKFGGVLTYKAKIMIFDWAGKGGN